MKAGPGWLNVPSGSWRPSKITRSAKTTSALAETRPVVNIAADCNKKVLRLPGICRGFDAVN